MAAIKLDVATAWNKYQFLGYEFLLWLWYLSSKVPHMIEEILGKAQVEITFGNSITIEIRGEGRPETLTIKGIDAGFEEAFIALAKGGSIVQANMVFAVGEKMQEFSFTLNGDDFSVRSLKCRPDIESGATDELEGAFIEKSFLTGVLFDAIDALYLDFIARRMAETWSTHQSAIREWVQERALQKA